MASLFLRKLAGLELEEKILHIAVVASVLGIFFPWIEGRWLGSELRTHTGFGFYTSFIGLSIFALNVYIIAMTFTPLINGKQIIRREQREQVRFYCSVVSTILVLAALSVLTKVTFDFQGMEVRFGVYLTLFGSMAAGIYSFLTLQEKKKSHVRDLFNHQQEQTIEDVMQAEPNILTNEPSPAKEEELQMAEPELPTHSAKESLDLPPPPAPPEAEEHRLYR